MKRFTAVIFDVDGTLVDSNDVHAQAWAEALALKGYRVPFERIRPLIGMGGDKLIPEVTGLAAKSDEAEALSAFRGKLFLDRYVSRIQPFPRVRELFLRLREERLRLAIATSAKEEELSAVLRIANVGDLLEEETSSDDADRSKPDPDIVCAALKKLGSPTEETVMIGDTPYDLEAAARAGIAAIAFRSGGWDDRDLAKAIAIYDGPWDLRERFSSSPLAAAAASHARNDRDMSAA